MSRQLERGVVGYWCPMLQTTGLAEYDLSVRKNRGTLTGMDAASDRVIAKVRNTAGRVLDFDGTNDNVNLGASTSLHPASFSVGGWCRLKTTAPSFQRFVSSRSGLATSDGYIISFPSGAPRFLVGNGTAFVAAAANPDVTTDTRWHHYIGTYSAGTSRFYIDGALQNSASVTVQHGNSTALLGGDPSLLSTVFLNGQIAEACLWNRALAPSEIRTLYRLGPGWFGKRESRLPGVAEQAAAFRAYWARKQPQLIGGGL